MFHVPMNHISCQFKPLPARRIEWTYHTKYASFLDSNSSSPFPVSFIKPNASAQSTCKAIKS